ncbi:MAG: hypothetical protein [Bacteriophage sp.]|jgi:hypothetical protein|nr:MAG: hypothetical protein [Bacteriophage sp.]UVX68465.1 MAG: hypothetical protein [Bacteriophage sp.]UVX89015.1 MAG: hypothetical protein [Bacteriophage sp.]DAP34061.1 MAG TPA: hypothetical protein [Caudoviricetes sp.]
MSAIWIIVLLIVAFVLARNFRSDKMWWIYISCIIAGLLVGMLSKEVIETSKKVNHTTSITQLVNTVDDFNSTCTQSLVCTVTEGTTDCLSGVVSNMTELKLKLSDALISNIYTNGRDSPAIEDDS